MEYVSDILSSEVSDRGDQSFDISKVIYLLAQSSHASAEGIVELGELCSLYVLMQ